MFIQEVIHFCLHSALFERPTSSNHLKSSQEISMQCYLYSLFFYKELAKLKCTQNLKENNSIKRKTGANISMCRVYARKYNFFFIIQMRLQSTKPHRFLIQLADPWLIVLRP